MISKLPQHVDFVTLLAFNTCNMYVYNFQYDNQNISVNFD